MPSPELHVVSAGGVTIRWRPTPWDARALGVNTAELVSMEPLDGPSAAAALGRLDEVFAADGVGVATTRVPAHRAVTAELEAAGYRRIETSHALTLALDVRDPRAPFRRAVAVEPASDADRLELAALAHDGFDYSRFHEDPRIHPSRARARHAGWIVDSLGNGDEVWVHRLGGVIAAVMSFRRDAAAGKVQLFLGGTRPGQNLLAPMFWTGVLVRLRDEGIKTVDTRVSAANPAALRLHDAFGFVTTTTDAGCTKIYRGGEAVSTPMR